MSTVTRLLLAGVLCASGCTRSQVDSGPLMPDLEPVREALRPGEPYYAPQPHRDHPYAVALSADASRLYVALRGSEAEPGEELAVVNTRSMAVSKRLRVGRSPNHLALHPGGRYLVVTNRFSAYLSVVDTELDEEIAKIATPYYATELLFRSDGRRAFVTNRWLGSVLVYDVDETDVGLEFRLRDVPSSRLRDRLRGAPGIPVGKNPRGLALDEPRARLFVANMPDLTVSVIDVETERELDTDGDVRTTDRRAPSGVSRIFVGAPVNDLVVIGQTLYVATTNRATGHPAFEGPDTDQDGAPGDGTPNLHFHDLQNELALFDTSTFAPGPRYTSDSLVAMVDDAPEGSLGLQPPELRVVRGSLPEQLAALGDRLFAVCAGSGELTEYTRAPDGALSFVSAEYVGLFPYGLAVSGDGAVFVANRLSEDIVRRDPSGQLTTLVVGDVSGGRFPATDAEIGEAVLNMTAIYAADGDATCEHCHRESSSIHRVASAPHGLSPFTQRSIPTMRHLLRQRPLMFENFLDETNFSPMLSEFGSAANFGPGRPRSEFASQDDFFIDVSRRHLGRDTSFGDALEPASLGFQTMARLLGVALIHEARALPNPNPSDTFAAERGKALFESSSTACGACHPAPHFTLARDSNPTSLPLGMRMFSPATFEGEDIDALRPAVKQNFAIDDHTFGVPTLRGLWDRVEHLYHDGRASSLIEALATPNHPALHSSERGFNERDGVLDLHGGTSHLSSSEMSDLIEYLLTIE